MSFHVLALAAIMALASLIRPYRLADLPNGFSPDEASYGYNGLSLLLTGKDRFGHAFPLFTDNFGDLISTSYMWLTVPAIALFGLDEFAVRLPAALIGIATVFVLYKLGSVVADRWVGLLAALMLAISPWHVQVSRYAERSPLLPLCFCLGLWFFLRAEGGRELVWSALCLGLFIPMLPPASSRRYLSVGWPCCINGSCALRGGRRCGRWGFWWYWRWEQCHIGSVRRGWRGPTICWNLRR